MGHARALLPLEDPKLQIKLLDEIKNNHYSVRKVEELVKELLSGEVSDKKNKNNTKKLPEEFNILKQHLSGFFNTKVQLTCNNKGKGKISIPFSNEEDLERIIEIFDSLK